MYCLIYDSHMKPKVDGILVSTMLITWHITRAVPFILSRVIWTPQKCFFFRSYRFSYTWLGARNSRIQSGFTENAVQLCIRRIIGNMI